MRWALTIAFFGAFAAQDPATERATTHFDRAASLYDARRYGDSETELTAARAVITTHVGSATPALKRLSDSPAAYPLSALEKGISGVVGLRLTIDSKGKVKDVKVLQSIPALDAAATKAARAWRFEAPLDAGHSVETSIVRAISFVYRDDRLVDECIALARFYEAQDESELALKEIDRAIGAARDEDRWNSAAQLGGGRRGYRGAGGGVTAPVRTVYVLPQYTQPAVDKKLQGTVLIDAVVDEQGIVRIPRILRSVPMLDQAALEAVRKWRYSPALENGQPVAIKMTVSVNFGLRAPQ